MGKPIYNHVTGLLDPPETIVPPKILIVEGLHPFFDERVNDLIDFSIYLDISDEVKFARKIQRDMAERGHTWSPSRPPSSPGSRTSTLTSTPRRPRPTSSSRFCPPSSSLTMRRRRS